MTENETISTADNDDINDGRGSYDVVVLVEHEVSAADATQIRGLHAEIGDQVVYHVLIPAQDAAAQLEASVSSLGAGDMFAAPVVLEETDLAALRDELRDEVERHLEASVSLLATGGFEARGSVVTASPVDALIDAVKEADAREAIVLTSTHVVQEFFHVDWTSQARRKVGVPVLHLLEHEIN